MSNKDTRIEREIDWFETHTNEDLYRDDAGQLHLPIRPIEEEPATLADFKALFADLKSELNDDSKEGLPC